MIDDHPNFQGKGPTSQKLVLPAHPEDPYQPGAYTQRVFVHPDQMRPSIPPTSTNPLSKLVALWRAEPAYKVLMVATVMVLIAGIIFATFLVNTLAQSANTTPPKAAIAPVATATNVPTTPPNTQPTFPTPSGGQGSNTSSSQPPKSSPVTLPTLAPSDQQPTQTPTDQNGQNQNVQIQITDFPQHARNNSDTQITVTANKPDVSVRLQVSFDQSFITNSAGPETTGADGTATLNWHVANVSFKQNFVARITAIATTQDGQQVSSQTISVDVSNRIRF